MAVDDGPRCLMDFACYMMLFRPLFTFLFHTIALHFFVLTFYRMTKNESYFGDASKLLKGFLVLWVMESLSAIPTSFYACINWPRMGWASDGQWIQWAREQLMN